jgi:DNA-directed RNA polymerase specialized sigma subunit
MSSENEGIPNNPQGEGESFFAEVPADTAADLPGTGAVSEARPAKSVKALLKQCLVAQRDAEFIEERITRLKSLRERMTTQLTGLPKGTLQFDESTVIAEIEELETEFARRIIHATQEIVRLFDMMVGMPENRQLILRMRYIDDIKWEEISEITSYSIRHCKRIHAEAIASLEANFDLTDSR